MRTITIDYEAALDILSGADHEDALQLAVAERTGCSAIATFNTAFANAYRTRLRFYCIGAS